MVAAMTASVSAEFAKYLSDKSYIVADLSLKSTSAKSSSADLTLRRLWELTDLSANDFADEVARFYGLARISLPQLIAASALTAGFSPRFLRETTVFPLQTAEGRRKLVVADPSDVSAVRAAEIVLGGPVEVEVASFEDIATALAERLGDASPDGGEVELAHAQD